ncbi:hypothetical protein [Allobranchiibius sp. CTAmp26]|uniref:hypothetical protein n=1 Tax=Allobranchiibius sp. CTAmp26 TaxID=2815214 RepID=UPI001AA1AE3F|nr:hypothetical protein [Allobranchiibius sp. CTAmp26]MBO1754615.1 hypothetical protein [Allobranchiibius sp. CTAmp26]
MYAFEGMTPATDVSDADAEWALSRMRGGDGVSRMVPDCFPAVVRLMHELRTGDEAPSPRWSDALPDFFQDGPNGFLHHQVEPYHVTDGTLPRDYLPRLLPLLIDTTTTPQLSWYALWKGFGGISGSGASGMLLSSNGDMTSGQIELERRRLQGDADSAAATARRFVASCAEIPWWGAREMALMSGSLSAVDALGGPTAFAEGVSALGPQMWWPADRAWFAATDIDDAWTYIAGPGSLIDAVLDLDRRRVLEAYEVSFDQRW